MKLIEVEPTRNTPRVKWEESDNLLIMEGRFFPENAKSFFDPLQSWLEDQGGSLASLSVSMEFEYISSSALLGLLQFLRSATDTIPDGMLAVLWKHAYDDEDIKKCGLDLQKVTQLPFEFVEEED